MKKIIDRALQIFKFIGFWRKSNFYNISYSQSGEDIIINFIFNLRGILRPSYIDIGAFHPKKLNNTFFFYKLGSVGINIEPNPLNIKSFIKQRPKDFNLQLGIGSNNTTLTYFSFSDPTLNTFDRSSAYLLVEKYNYKLVSEIKLEVRTIKDVLNNLNYSKFPDFLSLDVEGLDLDILKSIDYTNLDNCPKVICVESVEYSLNGTGKKNDDLIQFLISKGYFLYADTYINSIFINKKFWDA